jgi:hypothetical protein
MELNKGRRSMITSKLSKVIILSAIIAGVFTSVCATDENCGCELTSQNTCKPSEVKSPTWWSWLTDSTSTQFHFFELIELIYSDENTPRDFSENTPNKNLR